jgi:RNA polymerase sigma-70 factor (ECF subfamily)
MDAFAVLFEGLRPMAQAVAFRLAGANDMEDVVMDAFLKAWQSLPAFQGRSSLRTWMYRLIYNAAVDRVRARKRRREQPMADRGRDGETGRAEAAVEDATQPGPDDIVARRDMTEAVSRAMQRLSPEHRIVLELRYVEGLSYGEMAAATGSSMGTVMSRLFYAKRRLRRQLGEEEEEEEDLQR